MVDDASGHDVFAAALSGEGEGQVTGTVDAGEIGAQEPLQAGQEAPQGGAMGEAGLAQPEQPAQPQQPQDRNEGMVPSWRLRELNEQREAERRQWQQEQRELAQLRQYREHQERQRQEAEQRQALDSQNLFEAADPNAFIDQRFDHRFQAGIREAVGPIQQYLQQQEQARREERLADSLESVVDKHGREAVTAAEQWIAQQLQTNAAAYGPIYQQIMQNRRPYAELMRVHRDVLQREQIGPDLDAYNQRQQEAYLKDPAFLARAMEAHRQLATPVQTGVPGGRAPQAPSRGLPSLNRATSAQDQGAEPEDPQEVFAQALTAPRPRPR